MWRETKEDSQSDYWIEGEVLKTVQARYMFTSYKEDHPTAGVGKMIMKR